jgi:TfoX/Sxy family transcriptional regulator of competence genes
VVAAGGRGRRAYGDGEKEAEDKGRQAGTLGIHELKGAFGQRPAKWLLRPMTDSLGGAWHAERVTHHGAAKSPKSDSEDKTAFRRLVPNDERVTTRPMFGSVAAFANGYMFMGLYGADLFVRLPDDQRVARLEAGWYNLEPMPGKPMRDYVVMPGDWRTSTVEAREWGERALEYVVGLPPKK